MGEIVEAPLELIGGIMQGKAASDQGAARQAELNQQAKMAQISAKETQSEMLDNLQKTVGAIQSLGAQRNIDAKSPSLMAAQSMAESKAYQNITRERFNAAQTASGDILAGQAADRAGNAAAFSSYARAGGNFISSLDKAASSFAGGG